MPNINKGKKTLYNWALGSVFAIISGLFSFVTFKMLNAEQLFGHEIKYIYVFNIYVISVCAIVFLNSLIKNKKLGESKFYINVDINKELKMLFIYISIVIFLFDLFLLIDNTKSFSNNISLYAFVAIGTILSKMFSILIFTRKDNNSI